MSGVLKLYLNFASRFVFRSLRSDCFSHFSCKKFLLKEGLSKIGKVITSAVPKDVQFTGIVEKSQEPPHLGCPGIIDRELHFLSVFMECQFGCCEQ
jgi:hypothetical protein